MSISRRRALALLGGCMLAGSAAATPQAEPASLQRPGALLQGTLLHPGGDTRRRVPVALLIAGSGPTDRDGNSAGLPGRNESLRLLAEALAQAGIASLRYDKRGVGASGAAGLREADLRFPQFADDAAAWVTQLAADPRFSAVAVIGHSEGATLGLLAAQRSPVAAYVSLAGPGRDAATVLRAQLQGKLPPALAARSEEILAALQRGEAVAEVPAPLMSLYRPSVQPYLISWLGIDPAREIARLRMPVAILQGETDVQVSPADARLLAAAAAPGAVLHLIPGMNHVLKLVPAGDPAAQIASYSDPQLPLAPALVSALTGFLRQHLQDQSTSQ